MAETVTDEDRKAIWSMWLDGDSVNRIMTHGPVENRGAVNTVLAGGPPTDMLDDPRRVHGGRFFWIAVRGGSGDAFVVVKQPRRVTGDVFVKACRAIRREVRATGADLNLQVLEGADGADGTAALIRMVTNRGYLGFQFDESGEVSRFVPAAPAEEMDAEPPKP